METIKTFKIITNTGRINYIVNLYGYYYAIFKVTNSKNKIFWLVSSYESNMVCTETSIIHNMLGSSKNKKEAISKLVFQVSNMINKGFYHNIE
jgi:hypothetical protein